MNNLFGYEDVDELVDLHSGRVLEMKTLILKISDWSRES